MARPGLKTQRLDPYRNFRFRLKWDGRYVAGMSRVSFPTRTSRRARQRTGGPASRGKAPRSTLHEPLVLERGITHDPEFERWARTSVSPTSSSPSEASLKDVRKDVLIEMYDEAGQRIMVCRVFRCWVSVYQGLPDLDAQANAVVIQHLQLENEGWEYDPEMAEAGAPDRAAQGTGG